MNKEMIARELVAVARLLAKKEVPEAFKKEWKNKDKDGDGKENEPKPDFLKKKDATEMVARELMAVASIVAGCEKLPAGVMRDNCEKKSKGGDKKDDKDGDKKDGDKKDDKLPDFLKNKKKKAAFRLIRLAKHILADG